MFKIESFSKLKQDLQWGHIELTYSYILNS